MLIVTNNQRVKDYYEDRYAVRLIGGDYGQVLREVRDLVHKGHRLLTHPLSGSVKPGETPYKSIAITEAPEEALSPSSLALIEAAVASCEKFMGAAAGGVRRGGLTESVLADFMEIDLTLLQSAAE